MLLGAKNTMLGGDKLPSYDGCTVFDISVPSGGLTAPLLVSPNNVPIDWGDGSIDTIRTHTFTEGNYQIKVGSGAVSFHTGYTGGFKEYITAIRNLGINISSWTSVNWFWGGPKLSSCKFIGSVDNNQIATDFGGAFKGIYCTELSLPENFGYNATNVSQMLNLVWDLSWKDRDLIFPRGFCYNATNVSDLLSSCYAKSITFNDGFGCLATNITNIITLNTYYQYNLSIEFPDGFGRNATTGNTNFIGFLAGVNSSLRDVIFHGTDNGIKYSFSIAGLNGLSVNSAISIMRSLQPNYEQQTLTFSSNCKTEFESSYLFTDEVIRTNAKGWQIAFS